MLQPLLQDCPYYEGFVAYTFESDQHVVESIRKRLIALEPKKEEQIMTGAEQLRREGRLETLRENVLFMHKVGMEPSVIAQGTHTPLEEINRILHL